MHRRRHGRGGIVRVLPLTAVIRPGGAADLPRCVEIEIAAATRFAAIDMAELVTITEADPYMAGHGADHAADGSLFVADVDGAVAGYIAMSVVDGLGHVCEIDTDTAFAGRGIGRQLMDAGETWTRARGLPALSLSTFIDVPWNGPWYARLGFAPYPEADWGDGHRAIWAGQVASALDTTRRHIMIKRLA